METNEQMFPAWQFVNGEKIIAERSIARESLLTIFLNGSELVTLLCSPKDQKYLTAGFLVSEGLINYSDEILKLEIDETDGVVRVETETHQGSDSRFFAKRLIASGCGAGATFYSEADIAIPSVESQMTISADEVTILVNNFQHHSELYLSTHGVHSAALCNNQNMLIFNEDIGRHNAIDKIFGKCLLENIPVNDLGIVTSGRVSSEIVHKIAKRQIPLVISISAPTSLGIRVAEKYGITLVGSVKGKKFDVYTHEWRIKL